MPDSTTRLTLVFVYGTLQTGGRLNDSLLRCGGEYVSEAVQLSKQFVMRDLHKYPCIHRVEKMSGHYIYGEMWRVPTKNLGLLDRVEGAPGFFNRTSTTVWNEGRAYTVATYELKYNGDNLSWLPQCPIIESGAWDAQNNLPINEGFPETDNTVSQDYETCPVCDYWCVNNACTQCDWKLINPEVQDYYDDGIITDPWDSEYDTESGTDTDFTAENFTVDAGIYITNNWGESFGPYDSISEACCNIAAVANECEDGNTDSYTIGFRVYPNGMGISAFTQMEEETIKI
jgi:gamma-glutamylcyclotransferase (GGCT)/AIG2-like uncharacterized protein YtfP